MVGPAEGRYRNREGEGRTSTPLRILTESMSLDPLGGIEICTLQDSIELAARGHHLDLMYGADGVMRPRFESAGIGLQGPVSFDFDVHRPVRGLASFAGPARWARSRKPDVLWLTRFEHIYWAEALALWSRCPIVCQLHQMPNEYRLSQLRRGVAHFIAVSNFMREAWIGAGLNPDRVSVVSNALPPAEYPRGGLPERATARRRLGIPVDATIVLYYGRIILEKGVGTLLDAWAGLGLSVDQAQLILVGSPSPFGDPSLGRQLRGMDASSIRWFSMQSDVIPFLHAADLVVFPTWLDEGFGRVVIESMATGRPVVASRVGAVPEILSGPMERFLVEPRNSDELGARIRSMLEWRRTEPDLEAKCVKWVDERYSYAQHIADLEDELEKNRRRGPRISRLG